MSRVQFDIHRSLQRFQLEHVAKCFVFTQKDKIPTLFCAQDQSTSPFLKSCRRVFSARLPCRNQAPFGTVVRLPCVALDSQNTVLENPNLILKPIRCQTARHCWCLGPFLTYARLVPLCGKFFHSLSTLSCRSPGNLSPDAYALLPWVVLHLTGPLNGFWVCSE